MRCLCTPNVTSKQTQIIESCSVYEVAKTSIVGFTLNLMCTDAMFYTYMMSLFTVGNSSAGCFIRVRFS